MYAFCHLKKERTMLLKIHVFYGLSYCVVMDVKDMLPSQDLTCAEYVYHDHNDFFHWR